MKNNIVWMILFELHSFFISKATCQVQSYSKHEFKIGYGITSGINVIDAIAEAYAGAFVSALVGSTVGNDAIYIGNFNMGYNYYFSKRFAMGTQVGYNPILTTNRTYTPDNQSIRHYHSKHDFLFLQARCHFNYITRPKFQFYSSALFGYMVDAQNFKEKPIMAPHINLIGLRFGHKHAFTAEFGIGMSSLIEFGYSCRF